MQGVAPANFDNLSTVRHLASLVEEPTTFMNCFEVKAMLRNEKEKASIASFYLDLKAPYLTDVDTKPYLAGYVVPTF